MQTENDFANSTGSLPVGALDRWGVVDGLCKRRVRRHRRSGLERVQRVQIPSDSKPTFVVDGESFKGVRRSELPADGAAGWSSNCKFERSLFAAIRAN
jgi:hypothetical protein